MNFEVVNETFSDVCLKINYEDKDAFRKFFPTAKWLFAEKSWKIKKTKENMENIEKLRTFVKSEEMLEIERMKKEIDSQKAFKNSFAALKRQVTKTKKELAAELSSIEEIEETKKLLLEMKEELQESEKKMQEAVEKKKEKNT